MSLVIGAGVVEWVAERTDAPGAFGGGATGLGWARNGALVAGIAYSDFNGVNCQMHVAALPGARWLTREFLWSAFDYPFRQLKLRRVTGLVGEGNAAARRFDEHLGFELETTLRLAHPSGDLLVYVMWREKCRWLNENLHKARLRLAA